MNKFKLSLFAVITATAVGCGGGGGGGNFDNTTQDEIVTVGDGTNGSTQDEIVTVGDGTNYRITSFVIYTVGQKQKSSQVKLTLE